VRLWWEVARRSFRRHSTYRAATYAGVFTNTVFGFLKTYVLLAVYARVHGPINGFGVADAVTFSWLSQGFYVVTMSSHLPELAESIRVGDVAVDLYRPRDLQAWWLARDVGRLGFEVTVRGVVPALIGGLFFTLRFPTSPTVWLTFLVSALVAVVVVYAHKFLVTMSTFWLLDYRGTQQVATVLILFFSGMLVPLALFPGWLRALAHWTPYPSMLQTPIEVLLGKHVGTGAVASTLGVQLLWAVGLLLVGRVVLAAATRKVVLQGG
jgi:ABC-2 type transport system permease protein